jgi:hypothetical protein
MSDYKKNIACLEMILKEDLEKRLNAFPILELVSKMKLPGLKSRVSFGLAGFAGLPTLRSGRHSSPGLKAWGFLAGLIKNLKFIYLTCNTKFELNYNLNLLKKRPGCGSFTSLPALAQLKKNPSRKRSSMHKLERIF